MNRIALPPGGQSLCGTSSAAPNAQPSADAPFDDWRLMFAAVRTVLRQLATEPPAPADAGPASQAELLRAKLLDCVTALDQLDGALALTRPRDTDSC